MIDHVATDHDKYGKVPLCGQAMWDELVEEADIHTDDLDDLCWECKSILGLSDEDSDGTFTEDDQGNWHRVI